jgi:hypothetical protein
MKRYGNCKVAFISRALIVEQHAIRRVFVKKDWTGLGLYGESGSAGGGYYINIDRLAGQVAKDRCKMEMNPTQLIEISTTSNLG